MSINVDKFKTEIDEFNNTVAEAQKRLSEQVKPVILDYIKERAKTQSIGLIGVKWNQYTPYFNDGDPCEFHVGEIYLKFSNTPDDAGDYEDGFIGTWELKEKIGDDYDYPNELAKKQGALIEEISSFINNIPEEFMEIAFGDHKQIIVTADSLEVEEYDHD